MSQLRQNTSLTPPQRKSQEKSIWTDSDTKIRAVLTDQQKQQFDAMRADQMEKHQAMHGGGAMPPAEGSEPPVQQ
jgi:periplasmic protein CpxP/Spy